jgi:hypothetical protein
MMRMLVLLKLRNPDVPDTIHLIAERQPEVVQRI